MGNDDIKKEDHQLYDEVRAYYNKTLKLNTRNWLNDIHDPSDDTDIVEVRFKNTRKEFFRNTNGLTLKEGDVVAVEAFTGHDIGMVSLTGLLAKKQFNRKIRKKDRYEFLGIYRHAKPSDIEKWREAKKREISVRNRARAIAREQALDMKISDVEMQGDNTKAIFYYLADGRIDFRELIRIFAREFNLKVEMRQIGARQEAAMIGALDTSGRELCGSAWKTHFESVRIYAAKVQQLPSNAQKLTDHSGKLKTSLMYELDTYLEAWENFPQKLPVLETSTGYYYPHKTDVLRQKVWYSLSRENIMNPVELSLKRIKEIAEENRKGNKPPLHPAEGPLTSSHDFAIGQADPGANAFTRKTKRKGKSRRKRRAGQHSR
jgi:cell fate regulator YaaT (PSP1 superfamily)